MKPTPQVGCDADEYRVTISLSERSGPSFPGMPDVDVKRRGLIFVPEMRQGDRQ